MTSRRLKRRHAAIAVLDSVMLVAFLALSAPGGTTGFKLHEWVGLIFLALVIVHIVVSWSWVTATARKLRAPSNPSTSMNALLNTTLFVMMVVATVSGLIVSDYVAQSAGLPTSDDPRWRQVHNMTSSFMIPVIGLHVALNWRWITGTLRRYLVTPFRAEVRQGSDS